MRADEFENGKVTPGPVFPKFLTPDPVPKEKRRILQESRPVIRIRSHLWYTFKKLLIYGDNFLQERDGQRFCCPIGSWMEPVT